MALLFNELFKPVSRGLSLAATSFRLIFVAIMAVNSLNYFAPLVLLGGTHFLSAFKTDQLQALVLICHRSYDAGYDISLVFWGFHILLIGYLIYRSAFLPRILGVLLAIAGLCYLINSFAKFLSPSFAAHLFPYIVLPDPYRTIAAPWLVVVGVNVQRWKEQASAAAVSVRT